MGCCRVAPCAPLCQQHGGPIGRPWWTRTCTAHHCLVGDSNLAQSGKACQCCRVEACLPLCQQYGVHDAEAYLLERLGDIPAALHLYTSAVRTCNTALVEAVQRGALQLPRPATSR